MASITSLLKSAQAAREKIQNTQDAIYEYQYQLSPKTYNDFVDFQNYFQDRLNKTSDPSDMLTLTKKINSARSGYISNEIQRASIDVIEGRSTNTEKYGKIVDLFYQALDNGNYDLAQSLNLQLDNLSVTIQNEQEAAQRVAGTLAMNGFKSVKQLNTAITKGLDPVALPDGSYIKSIPMLEEELKTNGSTQFGLFTELEESINTLRQTALDAYQSATTQEAVDSIESTFGELLTGQKTFTIGGVSLTGEEIGLAARSAMANNPLYSAEQVYNEATGSQEFKLTKNKIDNFVWVVNDDGTYSAVQERTKSVSPYQNLNARITNDGYFIGAGDQIGTGDTLDLSGDKGKNLSIKSRLEAAGYTIDGETKDGGVFTIILPDSGKRVQATIQPDGSVRYFGDPGNYSGGSSGLYEINIFNGSTREVAPDETSDFGVQSQFGGNLSQATAAGRNYINAYQGKNLGGYQYVDPSSVISTALDFSGKGTAVMGSAFQGGLPGLQGGITMQKRIAQEAEQRAAALAAPTNIAQGATAFDLNTTPVRQFASNGAPVKQLTVSPVQAPTVNKVTVAQPQKKLTVAPAKPNSGMSLGTASGFSLQGGGTGIRL